MVASRVGVATSLCQSAGRYPPPHGILKENLLWVRTFDTIEELRAALVEFATRYNETWLVARHGYRTPAKVRTDQCRIDQNATADFKIGCLNSPSRVSQNRAAVHSKLPGSLFKGSSMRKIVQTTEPPLLRQRVPTLEFGPQNRSSRYSLLAKRLFAQATP